MKIPYSLMLTCLIATLSVGLLLLQILHPLELDAERLTAARRDDLNAIDQASHDIRMLLSQLDHLNKAVTSGGRTPRGSGAKGATNSAAYTTGTSEPLAQRLLVRPTDKERRAYFDLVSDLENPSVVESLNLAELENNEAMQALPEALRMAILDRAVALYNRGAVSEQTFLSGTPGYPR